MGSNPLIGQDIGQGDSRRYRIEDLIGSGGTGEVYLALDKQLGKRVALKLLRTHLSHDNNTRRHFQREVSLSTAIKSEHVVMVTDFGITQDGQPFYVMELLNGYSLRDLLKQNGPLSVTQTKQMAIQICDGLEQAHGGVNLWNEEAQTTELVKVIHCDLKPDNIFLVPTVYGDLVKILDFGIAKINFENGNAPIADGFWGTCRYAAPEQLEERHNIDERTDIYSLGVIIYEMLTGTDPFGLGAEDTTMMTWAIAHTTKTPIPLKRLPHTAHIPKKIETIVMRCLEKDPVKRMPSVRELKAALAAVPDRARGGGVKLGIAMVLALGVTIGGAVVGMGHWEIERHRRVLEELASQFRYEDCVSYSNKLPYRQLPPRLLLWKDRCLLEWGNELGGNGLFQESFNKLLQIEIPSLRAEAVDKIDLFAQTILAKGERSFQEGKGELAVVEARSIPRVSKHYGEAQRLIIKWTKETELAMEQMAQIRASYRRSDWAGVIAVARCFPEIEVLQKELEPIVAEAQARLGLTALPPCG